MILVGLTGGIATGKSTVASMFAARGAAVVDADRIAHGLQEPGGACHQEIVEAFGREILDPAGGSTGSAWARWPSPTRRSGRRLEAIMHPAIWSGVRGRDPGGRGGGAVGVRGRSRPDPRDGAAGAVPEAHRGDRAGGGAGGPPAGTAGAHGGGGAPAPGGPVAESRPRRASPITSSTTAEGSAPPRRRSPGCGPISQGEVPGRQKMLDKARGPL